MNEGETEWNKKNKKKIIKNTAKDNTEIIFSCICLDCKQYHQKKSNIIFKNHIRSIQQKKKKIYVDRLAVKNIGKKWNKQKRNKCYSENRIKE